MKFNGQCRQLEVDSVRCHKQPLHCQFTGSFHVISTFKKYLPLILDFLQTNIIFTRNLMSMNALFVIYRKPIHLVIFSFKQYLLLIVLPSVDSRLLSLSVPNASSECFTVPQLPSHNSNHSAVNIAPQIKHLFSGHHSIIFSIQSSQTHRYDSFQATSRSNYCSCHGGRHHSFRQR